MIHLIESFVRENTPAFTYKQEKEYKVMTESEKSDVANRVIDQLYQKTAERYVKLDLRTVESSQGDIEKVDFYDTLKESIALIRRLAEVSNIKRDDIPELESIETAFASLHQNKNEYIMGFKRKSDIIRILFTTIVMAILDATTVVLDSWLVYVKNPDGNFTLTMAREQVMASRNAKRGELAITNIMRYNAMETKGELKKMFSSTLDKAFIGTAVAVVALSIGLILVIRELTYFVFYSRAKVADSLNYQKKLLELNATSVAFNSNIDKAKRNEIIKKQSEIVKTLQTLANTIDVSERQATAATRQAIAEERKENAEIANVANILI